MDDAGKPVPRILIYSANGWAERLEVDRTIVEVSLEDPSAARAVGTIDNGTDSPCHGISVFMTRDPMACGAHGEGVILFDISDPIHPERLSHFTNPLVTNHHSTTFSSDGRTLVLDDDVYTGVCAGGTQEKTGVLWFYDISDPTDPIESGWFQLPRPNADHHCYAHESNVVPLPTEQDIVVTGWFGGGVNLVDFTHPTQPEEIASWVGPNQRGSTPSRTRTIGTTDMSTRRTPRRASPRCRTEASTCSRSTSAGLERGDLAPPHERADAGTAPGVIRATTTKS